MGQSITSTGDNDFMCGYTGANGQEYDLANYRHILTDSYVTLGTPVSCLYDLTVAGQLTASSLYGGAAVQITNQIDSAVNSIFWCDGKVLGDATIVTSKGQVSFTVNRYSNGKYRITFASPHPLGNGDYIVTTSSGERHDQIEANTATQFEIWTRGGNNSLSNQPFSFMVLA